MYELISPGLWRVTVGDQLYWAFSMTEVFFILGRVDVVKRAA